MNFDLTEERRMLQDSLRRWLVDAHGPEKRRAIAEGDAAAAAEIWTGLAELGVIGACFGEEVGGFGGAPFDLTVVFEELGRAGVTVPLADCAVLAGGLIAERGSDDQRALLEDVIAGQTRLAFAHAEPSSRYDLCRVETRAEKDGKAWRLDGRKAVVVGGDVADTLIVSARHSGEAMDEDGIGLFVVAADGEGVDRRGYTLMGGGNAAEITLERAEATPLGDPGSAFEDIERRTSWAAAAIAAEALGAMETAKDLTVDYLKQRKQFGQPIGKFQALQHRMADVLIEIEQARSAVINAAGHLTADRAERERHVSAAKNLVGRAGRLVAEESIQMHGGIGMTEEYELAHIAKRILMADHRFGDAVHHLERFVTFSAA